MVSRVETLEQKLAQARAERDRRIIVLVKAGLPKAEIARIVGLSRQQVHRIVGQNQKRR